jgi:hypothetical protein
MGKKIILGLFCFLFLFSFVTAQEHTGGEYSKQGAAYMDSGVIVNTLIYDAVKINDPITLYMTPYELTGKTLDNSTTVCRVGIVSPDGSRLLLLEQANFTIIGENDIWTSIIPGAFLNETGEYLYNWDCQEGIRGGYFNGIFTVTKTGNHIISEGEAIIYLISFSFLIFIFGLLMLALFQIPKDIKDDGGFIVNVSKLEYLRPIVKGLAWIVLTGIVFIIANITIAYLSTGLIGNFLFLIFQIMMLSNLVIIPLMIIRMIQRIVLSKDMLGLIERGVPVDGQK